MKIEQKIQQEDFVFAYIRKNGNTSALDEQFHEEFFNRFGGARTKTNYGAQPSKQAMKMLANLYNQGVLERSRIGLGVNWEPGFPRWVYAYYESEMSKGWKVT